MSELSVTKTRFADGMWEALVTSGGGAAAQPPELEAVVQVLAGLGTLPQEVPVTGLALEPASGSAGTWHLKLTLPPAALGDGLRCLVVRDGKSKLMLAGCTIAAGSVLECDMQAELAQMRAELDMLKAALRRLAAPQGTVRQG